MNRSLSRVALSSLSVLLSAGACVAACSGGDDSAAGGDNDASTSQDGSANDVTVADANKADSSTGSDAAVSLTIVSAGYDDTCAIVRGEVICWGTSSALGRPTTASANAPDATAPPVTATSLSSGWFVACAANPTETNCWENLASSDVYFNTDGGPYPNAVPGLGTPVTAIGAGRSHACAVVGGAPYCWGEPEYGVLGFEPDGSAFAPPTKVTLPGDADLLAVGIQVGCARLVSDGSVWCWGGNHMGELAVPYDGGFSASAVRAGTFTGVLSLGAGEGTVCIVPSDHSVVCWGRNAGVSDHTLGGMLGHDPNGDQDCLYGKCDSTPAAVPGITTAREVSVGAGHACAVLTDNTVTCWGQNNAEQSGHDHSTDIDAGPSNPGYNFNPSPVAGLTNVAHVSAGAYHTCAVTNDNHVFCWGANGAEQLGSYDGSAQSYIPIQVPGL